MEIFLFLFILPVAIGVMVSLPILLPPLSRFMRNHLFLSWSIAILFYIIAFLVTYIVMLPPVIKFAVTLNMESNPESSLAQAHRAEIEQEAWRQSMLPPFADTSCIRDRGIIVCKYARSSTISIWSPNPLHLFALLSSTSSFFFIYWAITNRKRAANE